MGNPILQAMGQSPRMGQMPNNPIQLIQAFTRFKRQFAGKNPQAIVQELLNSGKMSQQQFETLKPQAQGLQSILK